MSEAWVVNASPLILFSRIDRLDLIERLAPAILIPNAVIDEVNDMWVFRFPRRKDVEQQPQTEMRILPRLRERSPIALPAYTFRGRPGPDFPRHFGGYPKLDGVPAILLDPGATP